MTQETGGSSGSGGTDAAGSASGGSAAGIGGSAGSETGGTGGSSAGSGGAGGAAGSGGASGGSAGASGGGSSGSAGAPGNECPAHTSYESIAAPHTLGATFTVYAYVTALDLSAFGGYTVTIKADGVQQGFPVQGGSVWRPLAPQVRLKEITIELSPFTASALMPAGGLPVYCK